MIDTNEIFQGPSIRNDFVYLTAVSITRIVSWFNMVRFNDDVSAAGVSILWC